MSVNDERTYKIGEFAAMTGMTPSKVRFYDKAGLFTSNRDERGYRAFTPHDAFRANAFRVLLQYGFTVEQAIEMLDAEQGCSEFEESLLGQREELLGQPPRLPHDVDRQTEREAGQHDRHVRADSDRGDQAEQHELDP